ncbi:hypothetical protein CC86DRAFT_452759 [Ophiobolus disseminans]|uniref:Uncharacterized protein n=1 Tax=Ophiobolus disseminans TaxID=1469910 RepID=A0A6A7ACH3_9PLEO|nr:hypothetical protein CC86DRAFT_452759 [Ophiobolus disseminans]
MPPRKPGGPYYPTHQDSPNVDGNARGDGWSHLRIVAIVRQQGRPHVEIPRFTKKNPLVVLWQAQDRLILKLGRRRGMTDEARDAQNTDELKAAIGDAPAPLGDEEDSEDEQEEEDEDGDEDNNNQGGIEIDPAEGSNGNGGSSKEWEDLAEDDVDQKGEQAPPGDGNMAPTGAVKSNQSKTLNDSTSTKGNRNAGTRVINSTASTIVPAQSITTAKDDQVDENDTEMTESEEVLVMVPTKKVMEADLQRWGSRTGCRLKLDCEKKWVPEARLRLAAGARQDPNTGAIIHALTNTTKATTESPRPQKRKETASDVRVDAQTGKTADRRPTKRLRLADRGTAGDTDVEAAEPEVSQHTADAVMSDVDIEQTQERSKAGSKLPTKGTRSRKFSRAPESAMTTDSSTTPSDSDTQARSVETTTALEGDDKAVAESSKAASTSIIDPMMPQTGLDDSDTVAPVDLPSPTQADKGMARMAGPFEANKPKKKPTVIDPSAYREQNVAAARPVKYHTSDFLFVPDLDMARRMIPDVLNFAELKLYHQQMREIVCKDAEEAGLPEPPAPQPKPPRYKWRC